MVRREMGRVAAKKPKPQKKIAEKPKTGRPRKELDPDAIERAAGVGLTNEQIARVFGCSADLLEMRFSGSIEKGRAVAVHSMSSRCFQAGMGDSVPDRIFWLKARAGWRDRPVEDNKGSGESAEAILEQIARARGLDKKGSE